MQKQNYDLGHKASTCWSRCRPQTCAAKSALGNNNIDDVYVERHVAAARTARRRGSALCRIFFRSDVS